MKKISEKVILTLACAAFTRLSFPPVSQAVAQGENPGRIQERLANYGPVGVDGSVRIRNLEWTDAGNSLLLTFEVEVNGKALNQRQSWHIVPELTLPTGELAVFPTLLINGSQKERHFIRRERFGNEWLKAHYPGYRISIPATTDTVVTYRESIPYEKWMEHARLEIHQFLGSPKEKRQLYTYEPHTRINRMNPEPYRVQPLVHFITPNKQEKRRTEGFRSLVDFPVNVTRIIPDFRSNPTELARIDRQLRQITGNPHIQVEAVYLEGYASPEGSARHNGRLAEQRAAALKEYFVRTHGIDPKLIRIESVTEDWEGLRARVEGWSPSPERDRILAIIDSADSPDRKEQRLREQSGWRKLVEEVFPLLRRTEFRIDYRVVDFTVEQSRELMETHPELCSHAELYLLAMESGSDPEKRLEILETIARTYPEDDVALNNYAAGLIDAGEIASARLYIERISDKSVAANNIGVIYLLGGDYAQAEHWLKSSGSDEALHNLDELGRKREDELKRKR